MKTVRKLKVSQLPEPFKSYWKSKERLVRKYTFYDVDGELYIDDDREFVGLLHHWTLDGCAGIACFMQDQGIKERYEFPYVARSGCSTFECYQSGDYETTIRDPKTGESWVVHSG